MLHGEFFVTVGKKKTMSVYHAFLHEHYLILTDLQFSAEAECVLFNFVDCMQVRRRDVQLLTKKDDILCSCKDGRP